jgi:hypothetical protein
MSYEYYLQAHLKEEAQQIPTAHILSVFEDFITARGENYIRVEFEEGNSCDIFIDPNEPFEDGFMISRPCQSKQLGKCIYQVMLLGNFVFYEPDGKGAIIVNPATEYHLPADMIEALGKPALAESEDDFLELYFNNR